MTLFIFPSLSSFELKFLFFGFSLIFLLFYLRRSILFPRLKKILLVLQLIYLLLNLTSIAGNFKGEGIKYSSFDWQLARIFEISCWPNVNFNLSDLYFHYNRNYLSRYNTYGLNNSERINKKKSSSDLRANFVCDVCRTITCCTCCTCDTMSSRSTSLNARVMSFPLLFHLKIHG